MLSSPPPRPISRMGWHADRDSDEDEEEYLVPRLLADTVHTRDSVLLPPLELSPSSISFASDDEDDDDDDNNNTDTDTAPPPRKRKRANAIVCRTAQTHRPPRAHLPSSHLGPGAGAQITAGAGGGEDNNSNNNNSSNTSPSCSTTDTDTAPVPATDAMPPSPRRKCRLLPAIHELEEGEVNAAGPSSPRPSPPPMSPPTRARYSHKQLAWRLALPERGVRECTPPKFRLPTPRLHLLGSPRDERRLYALLAAHLAADGDTATLAALMRVSHAAYTPAAGELYRALVFTHTRTSPLVNTLTWPLEGGPGSRDNTRRMRLRKHVRRVTIDSLPATAPAAAAWIGVKGYPVFPLCPAAETVAVGQGAWQPLGESTLLASMVRSLVSPVSVCVDVHASHSDGSAQTPRLAALVLATWLLPAWARLSRVTVHAAQVLLAHASAECRRALFRPGVGYVLVFSQCVPCAPGVTAAGGTIQRKRVAVTRADQLWRAMARTLCLIASEVGAASGVTVVLPHERGATLPLPAEWGRGRATGAAGAAVPSAVADQVFGRGGVPSNFALLRVEDCRAVCDCCGGGR